MFMAFSNDQMALLKNPFLFIYSAIILFVSIYSLKKPAYNWDMLPYMGVILSYEKMDIKTIHDSVYNITKNQIPSAFYNLMTDTLNKYRNRVAQSPEAFHSQFPFYVVKPLYTRLSYFFYKAGASLVIATIWPSVISYFFIGLLLFYWLQKYWSVPFAFAGSLFVMLSSPLLSVANLSSPDMLSSLLLFAAIYAIIERRSLASAFLFSISAVFARLDNIIPALFFLMTLAFTNKWSPKISFGKFSLLLAALLLSYLAISINARSFGWSLFYYPSFAKQLNPSYDINNTFVFKDYISLAKSQLMTGLFFSFLSLFFFLVLLLLSNSSLFHFSGLTIEQTFAIVFVLIIIIRFILQPLITDRLYIPYYLSVIIFLVKKYASTRSTPIILRR
jgi:hypothetical protein